MPIDPNIAMGVRPIEQPNMLGQMAQAMQIRQANQEFDDVNAMRGISAKYGGDISNPDFLKEVGMRNPKTAADLRAKALANDKTTGEIVKSRLETSRELLSNVRTPEEYLAWHQGNHKDPLLGPLLASKGITADTSMATIQESLRKPGGFEELLKKSAMGLDKFYQDQTSRRNTDVSSGANYQQAETARQRLKMEQSGTWTKGIIGDRVVLVNNRTGEIKDAMMPEPEPSGTVTVGPITTIPEPTGGGAAPVNALAPQPAAGAAPVTNALVQPPATATPARQPLTTFNPQKVAKETVNAAGDVTQFNERGETIRVVPKAGKPSAAVEKEQAAIQKVPEAIAMNNDAIRKIDEMIGGVDARGNPLEGAKGQPHPGLSKATGLGGGVMRFFSGTEGKNFEIRHKEVLSQAFLDAFEALKGGGAITEKEGDKATAARTRMDLAQSKEEYITAAREYQGVLKRGVENARARMQRSGTAPPAGAPEDPLGIR
jgi:hypothetical protein